MRTRSAPVRHASCLGCRRDRTRSAAAQFAGTLLFNVSTFEALQDGLSSAQYYNFVRFGHDGYRYIMQTMQANARALATRIAEIGDFALIGDGEEQLPLVKLTLGHSMVTTLADDIAEACTTLHEKGGLHERERQKVNTTTGY